MVGAERRNKLTDQSFDNLADLFTKSQPASQLEKCDLRDWHEAASIVERFRGSVS